MQTVTRDRAIASPKRMLWLDLAKAYGMVLVFWGHIAEAFSGAGLTSAFLSYKLIYSFHMALFFLLVGYMSKKTTGSLFETAKLKFFTRIVPFLFFNLIGLISRLISDIPSNSFVMQDYLQAAFSLVMGVPGFNVTTWFLTCLVSVEMIHFFATKLFRSDHMLFVVALASFGLGWFLTLYDRIFAWNFWLIPAAAVAYLFYCIGYILKQRDWLSGEGTHNDLYKFLFFATVTLLTFNLNQNYFALPADIVFMSLSSYGQPLLFLLTGISGSLATIYLARWLSSTSWGRSLNARLGMQFVGQNTLILLGLNGLFFAVNVPFAVAVVPYIPNHQLSTLAICGGMTVLSLLICVPAVIGMKRYVPQLVGFPKTEGPILPRLML